MKKRVLAFLLAVSIAVSMLVMPASAAGNNTAVQFAITLGARGDAAIHAGGPSRAGSAPISMDGRAVFRFAVDALPKCLHTVLDETRLTLEDLSWVVCHQANSRIIDHCIKALQADPAKFYKNMDRHGNTSAASIPVALNELAESGQLTPGRPLACITAMALMAAFSAKVVPFSSGSRSRPTSDWRTTSTPSSPKISCISASFLRLWDAKTNFIEFPPVYFSPAR